MRFVNSQLHIWMHIFLKPRSTWVLNFEPWSTWIFLNSWSTSILRGGQLRFENLKGGQLEFVYMRRAKPSRAEDIPTYSQTAPNKIPNRWIDGSRSRNLRSGRRQSRRYRNLWAIGQSRGEPSRRADWAEDRVTFRADGREKCKPLKSGSEERKKKPVEEERTEDGHRVGRRVSEPRKLRSLVEGEFPKTAEEESRGLDSLRVRVRGRVSEFAEIPSIVYVCVCDIYTYVRTW
jgi:hypothetical protein